MYLKAFEKKTRLVKTSLKDMNNVTVSDREYIGFII
jgi:hypothetical protein